MNDKNLYVVRFTKSGKHDYRHYEAGYWCGLNKTDKQLRKAQIFTSLTYANRIVDVFSECEPKVQEVKLYLADNYKEVKHGHWIAVPSSDMSTWKAYKCSECKKMRYGARLPPYCQECGAKMDVGGDT